MGGSPLIIDKRRDTMMAVLVPPASAFGIAWVFSADIGETHSGLKVRRTLDPLAETYARSILVVDDDESIRDMLGDVLRAAGYAVRSASDGESALAAVEAERPALVLLDMRMPKVDGWEFARRLKGRGMHVPILVMTAFRDARRAAEDIGADGYLPKPFEIDQLLTQVSRYAERPPN
jgi:two-component system, chemotaxis family, chemotaxis protein CheY